VELDNQNISTVTIYGTTRPVQNIAVNFTISTYPVGATGQELTIISTRTNQKGEAITQLRLGNIPAEYGVRAECPSCVLEANSVTFTCCGKLKTDDFKQFDERWAYELYNTTSTTYQKTIGQRGCALTALSNLINYYSQTFPELNIPLTNPKELNDKLKGIKGFDEEHNIYWEKINAYEISKGHILYISIPNSYSIGELNKLIDEELQKGLPVIVEVYRSWINPQTSKKEKWGHFMLVLGKCGDNYIVSDPGSKKRILFNPNDSIIIDKNTQNTFGPMISIRRFKRR